MNSIQKKNTKILFLVLLILICLMCSCNKAETTSDTAGTTQETSGESKGGETTITTTPTSTPSPSPEPTSTPTPVPVVKPTLDVVDSGGEAFRDAIGRPCISFYAAYKNNCDRPVMMYNVSFDFQDNNGKLLATDQMVNCIPKVIKPGQTGYIYTYYYNLDGVDYNNGFVPKSSGDIAWADDFYEIEVSDVSFKRGLTDSKVEVIGRGTNNTGRNLSWVEVGAVFYDSFGSVLGFCYGPQDFPDGETTTFSISGDMLSPSYNVSKIDHVEVFIQGNKKK